MGIKFPKKLLGTERPPKAVFKEIAKEINKQFPYKAVIVGDRYSMTMFLKNPERSVKKKIATMEAFSPSSGYGRDVFTDKYPVRFEVSFPQETYGLCYSEEAMYDLFNTRLMGVDWEYFWRHNVEDF